MKYIFLLICVFFLSLTTFGQQFNSYKIQKEKREQGNNQKASLKKQKIIKNSALDYFYCNSNGFIDLDIKQIKQDVIATYALEDDNQAIIVGTSTGKLLKINNFSYENSSVEVICDFGTGALFSGLTDIAVDENLNYYGTNFNRLFSINKETCETADLPFSILANRALNSLSFDKQGNLYFGYGGSTAVYRYNADKTLPVYIWHDFGSGSAGGDFVQINDKIYVSWINFNGFKLFEVTVDANNNYVSHVELNNIKYATYGMAAELGKLYGVTPWEIYEIDLKNNKTITVFQNNLGYGDWWGAAGLHEAIRYDVSIYNDKISAENETTPFLETETNIISEDKTIYVRLNDLENGTHQIIEVNLHVNRLAIINNISSYQICTNETSNLSISPFDDILVNDLTGMTLTYHSTYENAKNKLNPLPKNSINYSDTNNGELYARIENTTSPECNDIKAFSLVLNRVPEVNIQDQILCKGNPTINVSANTGFSTDTYLWSTNETTSNIDISTIGDYWVKITNNGCDSFTHNFKVTESQTTVFNNISSYEICSNQTNNLDISEFNNLLVSDLTDLTLTYHSSKEDAENKTSSIPKNNIDFSAAVNGIFYARVENKRNPSCFEIKEFTLTLNRKPKTTINDQIICNNNDLAFINAETGFATDNYLWSTNETTSSIQTNVEGNHWVKITSLEGCESIFNFKVTKTTVPININPIDTYKICSKTNDGLIISDLDNLLVDDTTGITITYHTTINNAVNNISLDKKNINFSKTDSGKIFARIDNNTDCYDIKEVQLIINRKPEITINDQIICKDNELAIINAETGYATDTYLWSTNETTPSIQIDIEGEHWVKIITAEGCESIFNFKVTKTTIPINVNPIDTYKICSNTNDGLIISDLDNLLVDDTTGIVITYHTNIYNAENNIALDKKNINFSNTNNGKIFARIDNHTDCYDIKEVQLIINRKPEITIETQAICSENDFATINAESGHPSDSYLWSTNETTPSIQTDIEGEHWVKIITAEGCESIFEFNINKIYPATIKDTNVINFSDPNSITVHIEGNSTYLFKLDNNTPQESNIFSNVTPGYHTIYVSDINGCSTVSKKVVVVDFPKFLTPNHDGVNDTWHLTGAKEYPGCIIHIFDRYGKLIKTLSSSSPGWDGTYQGELLPVSDYWYEAHFPDQLQRAQMTGHFALKN